MVTDAKPKGAGTAALSAHSVPARTGETPKRNPGMPLAPLMFEGHAVNRSVKKQHQAAWLVNAIRLIDLTTLSGDDTAGKVRRLGRSAERGGEHRHRWR